MFERSNANGVNDTGSNDNNFDTNDCNDKNDDDDNNDRDRDKGKCYKLFMKVQKNDKPLKEMKVW